MGPMRRQEVKEVSCEPRSSQSKESHSFCPEEVRASLRRLLRLKGTTRPFKTNRLLISPAPRAGKA